MFSHLEQLKKATLTRYMLNPSLLSEKKTMPFTQNMGGALILLSPVITFWILPKMGFSPGFFSKLMLMVGLWVGVGIIMTLVDKHQKRKYALKFEAAADYFVRTAMTGLQDPTAGLAEIMVWCEENGKAFFNGVIRKHSRRYAMENRLNAAELASYEKRLREVVRVENERRKALHQEKMTGIRQIRESLLTRLYHPGASLHHEDLEQLRAELLPVVEELSTFQLIIPRGNQGSNKKPACVSGNLHLAVSPKHLIFLVSPSLSVSMVPDPVSFLLKNTRSNLYILPAAFIKELDLGSLGDRLTLVLQAPLPGIVMAHYWSGINPKNHKQLVSKNWREPLRSLYMPLEAEHRATLSKNLEALAKTESDLPECPICLEFSNMDRINEKEAQSGFICSSCRTRYTWGVDFLRRVTIFPVLSKKKGPPFLELMPPQLK